MIHKHLINVVLLVFMVGGAQATAMDNQSLMYKMLNSDPNYESNPTDIRYQRYWQRSKRLQWLANPRDMMQPPIDGTYDDI